MNFFKKNLSGFKQDPNCRIMDLKDEHIQIQYVGTDNDEDFFLGQNSEIYILKKEIDQDNLPNPNKRELIIVMGLYAAEEIQEVIRRANPNSLIVIIEPNSSFLFHALQNKDFGFLKLKNVVIFSESIHSFPTFFEEILSSPAIFLAGNIRFYGTYYYRNYDIKKYTEVVKLVKAGIKYRLFTLGNSIEDSLIGLNQNLRNIKFLKNSKDVSMLKNLFLNVPAIVVSAGPSLDKNIEYLKKAKGKAVIIAVDTIVEKLLNNGITPDFMCSIERIEEVYKFFYKDKKIPEHVTLTAPLLLRPEIFEEFKGNIVIPLRQNVGEYIWLNQNLEFNNDSFISMGTSSAHLAFGLAHHLGASPIVLVGQDLAYGESIEQSHSSGTIYDDNHFDNLRNTAILETPGYYGGIVKTNQIWNDFRKWFELEIDSKGLYVINATEGGSKIAGCIQKPLREVIEEYCHDKDIDVINNLKTINNYQFSTNRFIEKLSKQINELKEIKSLIDTQIGNIEAIKPYPSMDNRKLLKCLDQLQKTDPLILLIFSNFLLRHNLQPEIINSVWKLYSIEEVLSYENIIRNVQVQVEFLKIVNFVSTKIIEMIERTIETLSSLEGEHIVSG